MRSYGYVKSELDPTDIKIAPGGFPEFYDLGNWMGPIRDQGSIPKCVSCCLTDMVNFKLKPKGQYLKDDNYFYSQRPDKSMQGMIPKEALEIVTHGVGNPMIDYKLKSYSRLGSVQLLKFAIRTYGPVMVAMDVRSTDDRFWQGSSYYGGHAVLFTGYDRDSFQLRNSWGYTYGDSGYIDFPISQINLIHEAWCLLV